MSGREMVQTGINFLCFSFLNNFPGIKETFSLFYFWLNPFVLMGQVSYSENTFILFYMNVFVNYFYLDRMCPLGLNFFLHQIYKAKMHDPEPIDGSLRWCIWHWVWRWDRNTCCAPGSTRFDCCTFMASLNTIRLKTNSFSGQSMRQDRLAVQINSYSGHFSRHDRLLGN